MQQTQTLQIHVQLQINIHKQTLTNISNIDKTIHTHTISNKQTYNIENPNT